MLSLSEDSVRLSYLAMLIQFALQNVIPNYLQQLCGVAKLQAVLKLYLGYEFFVRSHIW